VLPGAPLRSRPPSKPVGLTSARLLYAAGDSNAARARNSLESDSASASIEPPPQRRRRRISPVMAWIASVMSRGVYDRSPRSAKP
jgi:hypothetical protein